MRRFFVAPEVLPAAELCDIVLPREVVHHIKTVLRLAVATEIILCDGRGRCCHCSVTAISSNCGTAKVLQQWRDDETALSLELIQGLPSSDKLDLILQKNTELGVTSFHPVHTQRSQLKLPPNKIARKMERWRRIVNEAARQSERSWLPQITEPQPLELAIKNSSSTLKLILWEEAQQPLQAILPTQTPENVAVIVGPEGGLSAAEVELAMQHGFIPVALGPRILRTETAGLAISAILQFHYGDLAQIAQRR